uniref:Reverse transcriptase domain-containing protein n=1 Tax=Tanacetum cinerariifolium TaxID=118510 RepID=A0A6L2JWM4_TANCI|nr:hypothetical protein [Tanacetum cinerariifolium]
MRSVTFTKPLNDKGAAINETSLGDKPLATKEKDPIQANKKLSFASVANEQPVKKAIKNKELHNELYVDGAVVTIPIEVVEAVKEGMENSPWLIRKVPLIWNEWTPNTILKKDEIKRGRSTYVRALIEISANVDLMDSLVIAIPHCDKEGHTFAMIDIEYEWTPPRCASCKIFDLVSDKGPKLHKEVSKVKVSDDGFTEVKKKKAKAKKNNKKQVEGVRLTKPTLNLQYRRVEKGETSKQKVSSNENMKSVGNGSSKHLADPIKVTTTNSFSALAEDDSKTWDDDNVGTYDNVDHVVNDSDNEDVDEYITMEEGTRIIVGWNHDDVDNYINNRPWCLLGDFNASLYVDDTSILTLDITMREFKECVNTMEVMDVQRTGLHFTWNQKPKGKDGILRKLDRILANLEFQDRFVGAHAIFKPYRISDHSPSVLYIPSIVKVKPNHFKFFNVSILDKRFKDVVREGWSSHVSGFDMFRVVKKLKGLKKPIRKMMYDKGNLHANVIRLHGKLDRLQTDLDNDLSNASIREEEVTAVVMFNEAILIEEKFLKQKEKITWLREGDANTAYFHKMLRSRVLRMISNTNNLFSTRLDANEALDMVRVVSSQEVKSAMFSMGNDKSPGPDGFTAAFFKDTWDIIGSDVTKAVCEFFTNGHLLKELNHTILALIPKVNAPVRVNDYRPISCCNVLFRCISKIIANRLKDSLKRMPRCTFKVDIQKAYDTVDWEFLRAVLIGKRGLRQGDPLSPYLFTLVMEVFTLMLHRRVRESSNFTYHRYCSELKLINLCFADDLFLFVHGDVNSSSIIKEALDEFKDASGLNPSMPKSKACFCNVINHIKLAILHVLPFEEDRLLVKYLGVPFVSSRLIFRDCKELIDKMVKYPILNSIPVPVLNHAKSNVLEWRNSDGTSNPFSVQLVWDSIRMRDNEDVAAGLKIVCPLYETQPDSYEHLFFDCSFSQQIWSSVKHFAGLLGSGSSLDSIVSILMPIAKRRSFKSCVGKLTLAAAAYFLWQECNFRLFKNSKRSIQEVVDCVMSSIRLKLLSCRFKKSKDAVLFSRLWELPLSMLK